MQVYVYICYVCICMCIYICTYTEGSEEEAPDTSPGKLPHQHRTQAQASTLGTKSHVQSIPKDPRIQTQTQADTALAGLMQRTKEAFAHSHALVHDRQAGSQSGTQLDAFAQNYGDFDPSNLKLPDMTRCAESYSESDKSDSNRPDSSWDSGEDDDDDDEDNQDKAIPTAMPQKSASASAHVPQSPALVGARMRETNPPTRSKDRMEVDDDDGLEESGDSGMLFADDDDDEHKRMFPDSNGEDKDW